MSPSTIQGPLSNPTEDDLATGAWRLDEAYSTASFEVPNFWGAIRVKGHFTRFDGTLDLSAEPAVELSVDAASLDTANAKRDKHLRSGDFFAVERHPEIRFASDHVQLDGRVLYVRGELQAAGESVPAELKARLLASDGSIEIDVVTEVDHRALGMTWSPLGMVRSPSTLVLCGRLVRDEAVSSRG